MPNHVLTPDQLAKVDEKLKIYMADKQSWVDRYGADAEKVMRGRAINAVKRETEKMNKLKLKELVKKSLTNEADTNIMADFESKLKSHNWYYGNDDTDAQTVYKKGSAENAELKKIAKQLVDAGKSKEAANLYNKYNKLDKISFEDFIKPPQPFNYKRKEMGLKEMDINLEEDIDLGHQDNEPHMIKGELYQIGKYAMKLYAILEELEEEGGEYDFPAWWQSKITTAKNMMSSAKHYLDFELKEPAIDAAVDALTGEEYHEGEPELEEGIHDKDILSAPYTNIKTPPKEVGGYDPKKRAANLAALAKFGPKSKDKELEEKKLTAAEKKKKEEIVKGMKDTFKGPKPAMYAIATEKAKKVAEILAKKLKENMDEPVIAEAKKVKFVLYTNPGNSTNAGYVAIGNEDVREVLRDAKKYSDSYKILYQGSGTQDDLVKAKQMFSDYRFGNESIDEKISETLAKKLKENNGADLKKGDTVEYEGKKYKIGSFDEEANLVYLNDLNGKPAEDSKGSYLKVHKTKVK
jgi:hypothetical protein